METSVVPRAARLAEQDYLARLEAAGRAAGIGAGGRAELRAMAAERFSLARDEAPYTTDPVSVVLDIANELGTPEQLARRARKAWPDAADPRQVEVQPTEYAAMVALPLGWLTAGLGLIVGIVAIARCPRWTISERIAAVLVSITFLPIAILISVPTPWLHMFPSPHIAAAMLVVAFLGVPYGLHGALRRRFGVAR